MAEPLNHHAALIYVMVTMSAVDRTMTDAELARIGQIVSEMPIFADFDRDHLVKTAEGCGEVLSADGGLEHVLVLIRANLPPKLRETAYAVALEVAAADLDSEAGGDPLPRNAARRARPRQANHGGNRAGHQGAQSRAVMPQATGHALSRNPWQARRAALRQAP